MATRVTYVRNPYPVPDVSREGVWTSRGPVLGVKVSPEDRDWDIGLNTHERLFAHHTLNSIRKDNRLVRPHVPRDALDLALASVYVHSEDTLVPKLYVPMQPETLGRETWRVLRNEMKIVSQPPRPDGPVMRVIGQENDRPVTAPAKLFAKGRSIRYRCPAAGIKVHPSSVKLSIEGPHSDQSNPGYSRKVDGTFYSI